MWITFEVLRGQKDDFWWYVGTQLILSNKYCRNSKGMLAISTTESVQDNLVVTYDGVVDEASKNRDIFILLSDFLTSNFPTLVLF